MSRILSMHYPSDPDILLARHQALDIARQKMQEQYNKAASESLEKRKAVCFVHLLINLFSLYLVLLFDN